MKRVILILFLSSLVFGYGCSAENTPHSNNPVQGLVQHLAVKKSKEWLYISR